MLRACLKIWIVILSYQRKFIWKLARSRTWRSQSTFDIRFSVHICFLNQIFSLCYLLSFRHAFYIIFNFHRDERCKFHTRYRCDQRVERNKIVVNLWRCRFQHNFISINNDDDSLFLTQQISRTELARLIVTRSNFAVVNCSSKYANN